MNTEEHNLEQPVATMGAPGGTGFQPVVSGILPETRGAQSALGGPDDCESVARAESGRMPDSTGWKPVPPGASLVMDVKKYLATRGAVARFEYEKHLFDRLPYEQRSYVRRLQAAFLYVWDLSGGNRSTVEKLLLNGADESSGADGRYIKIQPACERALGLYPEFRPLKTFRGKYDAWREAQDWLILVNRAKAGAEWQDGAERGLPDDFLDYVAARMGDFKRGDAGEQAIASLKRQWFTGKNHRGVAEPIPGYEKKWLARNIHLQPVGWHTSNIRRAVKRRAKFTASVKALRHAGIASARAHLPQAHSTRAGAEGGQPLRFMELVQFDDVRCDFRVIDIATGQICDLWLLIARDVATTMLLGFGMRPALARDDGTQEHLKLRDMKQLFGWLLETYGLPPWQMTAKIERGTASLAEGVRAALGELLGDRIAVSCSAMIGGKSSVGYDERATGNSKGKAMLEGLNRLQHMMTSHFPGQIGASYAKRPADLVAREDEAREIWRAHRAQDRAELRYPVLTIPQAREALREIFELQNQRTDHCFEGFEKVVEMFDGEKWVPAQSRAGMGIEQEGTKIGESEDGENNWAQAGRVTPCAPEQSGEHTRPACSFPRLAENGGRTGMFQMSVPASRATAERGARSATPGGGCAPREENGAHGVTRPTTPERGVYAASASQGTPGLECQDTLKRAEARAPGRCRVRMESPVERAARLCRRRGDEGQTEGIGQSLLTSAATSTEGWSRVSPEILTVFYEHSMRSVRVLRTGEAQFKHEGKILRFAPPSPEFALAPETKCLGYFNPDDPRFLTLTDGRGSLLGTWLRRGLVAHNDREALAAAIQHSTTALNQAKARAAVLAADETAQLAAMRAHNAGFVAVVPMNREQSAAKSEIRDRRSEIKSSVASHAQAVAGEKQKTKKRQQSREAARNVAREALLNLAA